MLIIPPGFLLKKTRHCKINLYNFHFQAVSSAKQITVTTATQASKDRGYKDQARWMERKVTLWGQRYAFTKFPDLLCPDRQLNSMASGHFADHNNDLVASS